MLWSIKKEEPSYSRVSRKNTVTEKKNNLFESINVFLLLHHFCYPKNLSYVSKQFLATTKSIRFDIRQAPVQYVSTLYPAFHLWI